MYGLRMGSGNADSLVCRTSVLQLLVSEVTQTVLQADLLCPSFGYTWSNSRIQFASHGPTQGFNLLHMVQLKDSICFTWSNSRILFASHGPTQGFNLLQVSPNLVLKHTQPTCLVAMQLWRNLMYYGIFQVQAIVPGKCACEEIVVSLVG